MLKRAIVFNIDMSLVRHCETVDEARELIIDRFRDGENSRLFEETIIMSSVDILRQIQTEREFK